jgi:hypothetical protein
VDLGTNGLTTIALTSDGVLWGNFVDGPADIALSSDGARREKLAEGPADLGSRFDGVLSLVLRGRWEGDPSPSLERFLGI